jgi:hypothetical protein
VIQGEHGHFATVLFDYFSFRLFFDFVLRICSEQHCVALLVFRLVLVLVLRTLNKVECNNNVLPSIPSVTAHLEHAGVQL